MKLETTEITEGNDRTDRSFGSVSEGPLESPSIEYRAEREKLLRSEIDARPPLEQLFDRITAARITYYRPTAPPHVRQDLLCFCCGRAYRPDDIMDGENVYLCASCMLTRKEGPKNEY